MKKTLNLCLLLLLPLLLWSCDDGSQNYTRLRVDSEYFDVVKLGDELPAAGAKPNVRQTAYGSVAVFDGCYTVYRLKKGTEFTMYEDKDWDRGRNLFIIGGKVVDESVEVPWDAKYIVPDELSILKYGDITKEKYDMSVSEYQAYLREVCPPKAQARSMSMWIAIGILVAFVFGCFGFAFNDDDKEKSEDGKTGRSRNMTIVYFVWAAVALLLLLSVPVSVYLYFYLNPDESLWFITDWGFFGFFVGAFVLFMILIMAVAPLFMVGDCFRKIFSRDWWKGLLMLLVVAGLCVVSYFFLKMVFTQIWEQCGFLIKSLGVLILLFMAPTGLAAGFSSDGKDDTPEEVSDGNGNRHFVAGSQGSDTVTTTDGRTMRRQADGTYRDLHKE